MMLAAWFSLPVNVLVPKTTLYAQVNGLNVVQAYPRFPMIGGHRTATSVLNVTPPVNTPQVVAGTVAYFHER